jgi:L-fuconate dehydratase
VPLWNLLLILMPREIVNLLDLSYLEDDLTPESAIEMIEEEKKHARLTTEGP